MASIIQFVSKRVTWGAFTVIALSLIGVGSRPCLAQRPDQTPMSSQEIASAEGSSHTLGARMYAAVHDATVGIPSAPADTPGTTTDDQFHLAFAPYLWFAGMHGYAGALGFTLA